MAEGKTNVPLDKYSAVWVSHTSISDFLTCPRAYYIKHIYRNPATNHKVKLMSPSLALGQTVHDALDSLSSLPVEKRFNESLIEKFEQCWKQVSGKKGGFVNPEVELQYKNRGIAMLQRVMKSPGPLGKLAVKIKMDLPYHWLSEEDNIILCGKIDWIEYLPETDTVHIIDFKTGKKDENPESLQLPIYHLLTHHCQKRKATKASYWYLERNDEPVEVTLPPLEESLERVLKIATQVKVARALERFKCEHDGCIYCKPLELVVKGEAEFVGTDNYGQDVFLVDYGSMEEDRIGEIL